MKFSNHIFKMRIKKKKLYGNTPDVWCPHGCTNLTKSCRTFASCWLDIQCPLWCFTHPPSHIISQLSRAHLSNSHLNPLFLPRAISAQPLEQNAAYLITLRSDRQGFLHTSCLLFLHIKCVHAEQKIDVHLNTICLLYKWTTGAAEQQFRGTVLYL